MNKRIRVAGVTFEGRQTIIAEMNGDEPARLIPEPTNPYDENAIGVWVSLKGRIVQIGYIPKEFAAWLAPRMQGENLDVKVFEIVGGFEKHDGSRASLGVVIELNLTEPGQPEVKKPESVKEYFDRVKNRKPGPLVRKGIKPSSWDNIVSESENLSDDFANAPMRQQEHDDYSLPDEHDPDDNAFERWLKDSGGGQDQGHGS